MKETQSPEAPTPGNPLTLIHPKSAFARVKIYCGSNRVDGRTYEQFTLVWKDGKRCKRRFATWQNAHEEAHRILDNIFKGDGESARLRISADERRDFLTAKKLLAGHNVSVSDLAREYVRALANRPKETRRLDEVIAEYHEIKTNAGVSDVYLRDLKTRLGQFQRAFPGYRIGSINGALVQKFIDSLKLGPRSKRNHLRLVSGLFTWAEDREYVPTGTARKIARVQKPKLKHTAIGIFSPDELREMLAVCREDLVPWLALGAFAGLRTAELKRLDWRDVDLKQRNIIVGADKAKTASRRIVPICDALFQWLEPLAQKFGPVFPLESDWHAHYWIERTVNKARTERGEKADFDWKQNGLRHSFISYRCALTADIPRTSFEAGNSPAMIHAHYRALVDEDEARRWFAIVPERRANVVPMVKEGAA